MPSFAPSFPPGVPVVYTGNGDGFPGIGLFIAFAVIAIMIAIGTAIYRVSTARRIAEQNGLNPSDAGRVALLNDNAVTATYLAGSLQRRAVPPVPPVPVRSIKARLAELQQLHEAGQISDEEYAEGRKHVINGA